MVKDVLRSIRNTVLGTGSIYVMMKEEITIMLSIIIALLTIIYLVFQIKKCLRDMVYRELEITELKNSHKHHEKKEDHESED